MEEPSWPEVVEEVFIFAEFSHLSKNLGGDSMPSYPILSFR